MRDYPATVEFSLTARMEICLVFFMIAESKYLYWGRETV